MVSSTYVGRFRVLVRSLHNVDQWWTRILSERSLNMEVINCRGGIYLNKISRISVVVHAPGVESGPGSFPP